MAKQKNNRMVLKNFEEQANKFIRLTLDYCEEELRHIRLHDSLPKSPKRQALSHAAMAVQQSIKVFLTILQTPND